MIHPLDVFEKLGPGRWKYKGYLIERMYSSGPGTYQFNHDDYDGPGDRRVGDALTLRDTMYQIDHLEGDYD